MAPAMLPGFGDLRRLYRGKEFRSQRAEYLTWTCHVLTTPLQKTLPKVTVPCQALPVSRSLPNRFQSSRAKSRSRPRAFRSDSNHAVGMAHTFDADCNKVGRTPLAPSLCSIMGTSRREF